MRIRTAGAVLALSAALLHTAAQADVWGYIDARGVAHFSAERVDERYTLFYKGDDSFDTRQGLGAYNPDPEAPAQPVPAKLLTFFEVSPSYKLVKPHLREAALKHGIEVELLQALIVAESGFDRAAVSPNTNPSAITRRSRPSRRATPSARGGQRLRPCPSAW